MKKNKFFKLALILGIVIRLVLAVTTYHSDLSALTISSHLILKGHIFDLYQQGLSFVSDGLIYQPLAYFIPSLVYLPFISLLSGISSLLIQSPSALLAGQSVYLPILIYKLPLILADLSIIWLLPKLFNSKKKKINAQILWALNPVAIYVSSMIGQVDAILIFFLLAATISAVSHRYILSAILLSLSALTKPLSLALLPLLGIYALYKKDFKQACLAVFSGFGLFALIILPFLSSQAYKTCVLGAHHLTKSLFAGIEIASGTQIPWFFIFYSLIFLLAFKKKINLIQAFGAVILSTLSFTHFHPQWFVWITPWLIYNAVESKNLFTYFASILAWLFILFSFESSLHLNIFLNANKSLPQLPQLLTNNLSILVLLARAWLVAVLITDFIPLFHEKNSQK